MAVGYGSGFVPSRLLTTEIGQVTTISNNSNTVDTFLRILLTIGEVIAAFTPIGVIGEGLVGLAAGIGNELIDIKNGNANAAGAFLNLATPFIGAQFAGIRNIRGVGRIAEGAENLLELGEGGAGIFRIGETSLTRGGVELLSQSTSELSTFRQFNRGIENFRKLGKDSFAYVQSVSKFSKAAGIASKEIDNVIREAVEDKRFSDFLAKSGLTVVHQLELKTILKGARTLEQQRSLLIGFIRTIEGSEAVRLYENISKTTANILVNEAKQLPLARLFAAEYDNVMKTIPNIQNELQPSMMRRFVHYLGTAKFDRQVVQRVQAVVDPNDAGRAGIERLYQVVKTKLAKYIKYAGKTFKELDKIEDAFVRSGGVRVESAWHLGYKVVKDLGLNRQIVMISFKNGKRPVMVIATDKQLMQYDTSPGHTYLKYWALSRGGKNLGLAKLFSIKGLGALGRQGAQVLSFLNVQALKNVLSLVSNIVENSSDLAEGKYFTQYERKFIGSLSRTAVSRSFRLLGRVVGGGVAKRALGNKIGSFIGQELQRVGSQVLSRGINNVRSGLSFSGSGMTQDSRGNYHMHKANINFTLAKTMALTSMRSNLLKRLRAQNPNSAIVNTLSARRKLYQIKRIPNAFVPGRPFKGIKI